MIRRNVARFILLLTILVTIGCDQVTKRMATSALADRPGQSYLAGLLRLEYAENAGGFLGLGADLPTGIRTALLTVATGLLLLGVMAVAIRQGWRGWSLVGVALFIAGGASNWIDRFARGSVVDFMIIGLGPVRTGIFNVADVAIMLGMSIVLLSETEVLC
jgi:signal peptidase II